MLYKQSIRFLPWIFFVVLSILLRPVCGLADQNLTMSVPSTQPWTDTGLDVAAGDIITITVTGEVKYGDPANENTAGPDGIGLPSGCATPVDNSVYNAVVGNIATSDPTNNLDGKGFTVGSSFQGQVPISNTTTPTGRLYLGYNDGGIICSNGVRTGINWYAFSGDNSGSFTATIEISSASPRQPSPVRDVPTLSLWGILVLVLLLGFRGVLTLYRCKKANVT